MRKYLYNYQPRYKMRPEVRDRYRAHARAYQQEKGRFARHGITMDQFHAMFEAQGECCKICRLVMARPHIDHDHKTGRIRGLLCYQCNVAIGLLKDDPIRMRVAAAYVEA